MQPSHLDISELCSSVHTGINFGPINFPPPVCCSPRIGFASPSRQQFISCSRQLHLPRPAAPLQLFTLPLLPLLLLNPSSSGSMAWIHPPAESLLLLHSMDPSSCLARSSPPNPVAHSPGQWSWPRGDLAVLIALLPIFKVHVARLRLHLLEWPVKVMVCLEQPSPNPYLW